MEIKCFKTTLLYQTITEQSRLPMPVVLLQWSVPERSVHCEWRDQEEGTRVSEVHTFMGPRAGYVYWCTCTRWHRTDKSVRRDTVLPLAFTPWIVCIHFDRRKKSCWINSYYQEILHSLTEIYISDSGKHWTVSKL